MASPYLPTEQAVAQSSPEMIGLERKRKLADLLTAQGIGNQPQGQMISGHYVAPSWTQQLNPMANLLAGQAINERTDKQQQELADLLRGKKQETLKAINDAFAAGDNKLALRLATESDVGGKEFIAPLLGNMIPKAPDIMSEKDKEDIRIREAQIKAQEKHYAQMAAQHNQSLAQGRIPSGYRATKDGGLEAIPGGPADQKAQTVNVGRETVNTLITGLKDQYNVLKDAGGITSKNASVFENIPAYISSTGAGQATGKFLGTQNQSARNTISQSRPLLLQAIAKATGMSSKQMDSNTELQMYLKAATDPSLDYEANMLALNQLENLYGIGGAASTSGGTGGGLPSAADIDAEIARRRKK